MTGSIRRYVAVIQDPRGYAPTNELEIANPYPEPPRIHSVVKVEDHERVYNGAVDALAHIAAVLSREPTTISLAAAREIRDIASEALIVAGRGS